MYRIVLFGLPGAGKGTQAKMISERMNREYGIIFGYISTGQILREMVEKNDPVGIEARDKYWGKEAGGKLVPDGPMIDMMKKKLEGYRGGFLLDGFPRNVNQAREFESLSSLDAVVHINLMDGIAEARMLARRSCNPCKIDYGFERIPKIADICDQCHGNLSKREDDNISTIRKRLKVYYNETEPLTDYYSGKNLLISVDGEADSKRVFEDVWGKLDPFLRKKGNANLLPPK